MNGVKGYIPRSIHNSMNISSVSCPFENGLDIDILVSPRSGRSGPDGFDEWRNRLIIKVKAPPLDGKANKEVEELFKELTGCKAEIRSGHLSRQKTVTVFGDPETILKELDGIL
jgi:TIGR00251 family protein